MARTRCRFAVRAIRNIDGIDAQLYRAALLLGILGSLALGAAVVMYASL